MTEPFKFVVSNDPAKARQAIGTLGVPADYDVSGSGDYMVNDVVRYTDPAPSPTTDFTGLYACITDHTSGSPKAQPGRWELVATGAWAGLSGKPDFRNVARAPEQLVVGAITRDANGAATSASVTWPDGSPGTYTATTVSTAFPGAVDAYTITYGSPAIVTYTQDAVTRDASGVVTAAPAITVS